MLGDGKGNVSASTDNTVYCRLTSNSSVIEVLNYRVAPIDGLLVRIAKTPEMPLHWQVIGQADQRVDDGSGTQTGGVIYNTPPHHKLHEYLAVDQVNVDFRQITTLRVYAYSGMSIGILAGLIPRSGSDLVVPTQTLDLTGDVPATGALYALITIDSTGALAVTPGATTDGVLSLSLADIPDTPAGHYRLAAIRLYAGQTTIRESLVSNDIRDLRYPQENIAGSAGAIFGPQTANTIYAGPSSGAAALPTFRTGVTDDIASGVFPIARGGTNAATATDALSNLLPSQSGQAGNVLGTDGTNAAWVVGGGGSGGGTITITTLPVGTIVPFGSSSIPSGWLECNGAAVSRTTYAALFTAIGTTYGAGNGSTTFNVPDLRGRTSIGQGTGSGLTARTIGATGGEETHILSTAELPAHTHTLSLYEASPGNPVVTKTGDSVGNIATINSGSTGSDAAHNTMPPFVVTAYIIKYTDTATSSLIFDDGANPETVLATTSTGDDIYAARRDHVHAITPGTIEGQVLQAGSLPFNAQWSTNTLAISGNSTINGSLIGNITGGGTLATGGFTGTIPEAMTFAGRNVANTFTAVQTITAPNSTALTGGFIFTQTKTGTAGGVYKFTDLTGTIDLPSDAGGAQDFYLMNALIQTASDATVYNSANLRSFYLSPQHNGSGTINTAVGGYVHIVNNGAGNISTGIGYISRIVNVGTGKIVNTRNFWAMNITNTGGGTAPNTQYAYYSDSLTTGVANNYLLFGAGLGRVRIGDDVVIVGGADRTQLSVTGHTTQAAATSLAQFTRSDENTNAVATMLGLNVNTTGTAADGFGGSIALNLESSTTADQAAAQLQWLWTGATHASRTALLRGSTVGNAVTSGYFGSWAHNAVANTAITIIPDGTGDMTAVGSFVYTVKDNTASTTGGGVVVLNPGGAAVTLLSDGTDTCQITCAANGSVTIARSAGTHTFSVSIWGTWQ